MSPSKADRDAFRRHVAGHPELSRVFEIRATYFKDFRAAYQWLRTQTALSKQIIDCVFLDPAAVGGTGTTALGKAIDLIKDQGFEDDQIIALPDAEASDALWIALKDRLGDTQVFQKEDALSLNGVQALTDKIEALMSKRSDSGNETLQYSVVRLEAKVDVLAEKVKSLQGKRAEDYIAITKRLDDLQDQLRILSQTIFQGPDTGAPALVTELTELKRYARGLDRDIGALAEAHKERLLKVEAGLTKLEGSQSALEQQREEFRQQRALKRIDYAWRIGLIVAGTLIAGILNMVTATDLGTALEILLRALPGN